MKINECTLWHNLETPATRGRGWSRQGGEAGARFQVRRKRRLAPNFSLFFNSSCRGNPPADACCFPLEWRPHPLPRYLTATSRKTIISQRRSSLFLSSLHPPPLLFLFFSKNTSSLRHVQRCLTPDLARALSSYDARG